MAAGRTVESIAEEFGTPFFLYDLDQVRSNFQEALEHFGPGVAYATKAFLSGDVVRLASEEGMSLDVSTDGEYDLARTAGFPPERLVVHGNNKSSWLLHQAVADGVQWVVIDNWDDLHSLSEIALLTGRTVNVLLRVNPGIEVHTHIFNSTGNRGSKFGLPVWTGDAAKGVEAVRSSPGLELKGLHTHIGSLVYSLENFSKGLVALSELIDQVEPEVVVAGGGLGVPYLNDDVAPSFADWSDTVKSALRGEGYNGRILAEPGRCMVAGASITVYRVGVVRENIREGRREFIVAVDGGMSDNPRPLLYDSGYEVFMVDDPQAGRTVPVRLVGSHCESGDTLIQRGLMSRVPVQGDLVCTPVTGAYGYSMASNYNRMPRPAVLYIEGGEVRVGLKRESFDAMRSMDLFFG